MYIRTIAALGLIVGGVAACGDDPGDRALTGGALGAAGGAAAGAAISGDPVTGALAGGAIGAATGALTDEDDIDLGSSPW